MFRYAPSGRLTPQTRRNPGSATVRNRMVISVRARWIAKFSFLSSHDCTGGNIGAVNGFRVDFHLFPSLSPKHGTFQALTLLIAGQVQFCASYPVHVPATFSQATRLVTDNWKPVHFLHTSKPHPQYNSKHNSY